MLLILAIAIVLVACFGVWCGIVRSISRVLERVTHG